MDGDATHETYKEVKNEDQGNHISGLNKTNFVKAEDDANEPLGSKDSIGAIQQYLVSNATSNNTGKGSIEFSSNSMSSIAKTNELEHAKAEMGQVREENERLVLFLEQIRKDYRALQMQFKETNKQDNEKKASTIADDHESELVSLSLGRYSKSEKSEKAKDKEPKEKDVKEGLSLALDCTFDTPGEQPPGSSSPVNSSDEIHCHATETWPPSRAVKRVGEEDASLAQSMPTKKVRVSVRARCDTPTMNDGCQWRKYGQKIAKGNPCPRAYYRCTVAPLCPVRKQVQRCAEDTSILITTYEGTHNHPLPMSATAMASTTSAAASMILSGSSTSQSSNSQPSPNMATDVCGLNLYLSSSDNAKLKQFYVHSSSLSSSPSYPTITLDLAPGAPSNPCPKFPSSSSKFAISNGLSFASPSEPSNPMHWGNGILNYGNSATGMSFGRNYQVGSSLNIGRPVVDYAQKSSFQSDVVAAATKAITNDPNFQSALVTALTSIISNGASENAGAGGVIDALAQKMKWGDHLHGLQSGSNNVGPYQSQQKSSYFSRNASSASPHGNVLFLPPSLSFSSSGSGSTSLGEKKKENAD